MNRRRRRIVWLAVAVLAASGFGSWAVAQWRFATSLEQSRLLMEAQRFPEARERLLGLRSSRPSDPEVAYRLGVCEHAVGRPEASLAAWAGVSPGNEWWGKASLARARTLVGDMGRFSEAEALLEAMLDGAAAPADRDEVRRTLSELYFWQGRREEVLGLIEENWRNTTDPTGDLVDHWKGENAPTLFEAVRNEVERAAALSPGDDRVWLAQADLALQTGRLAEAKAKLERCLEARPEDQAVWRARLELARVEEDLEAFRLCLAHLRADRFTVEKALGVRAWLAKREGDGAAERAVLERLIAVAPSDAGALDRLAVLAAESGEVERSRELRVRKATCDAAKDRYRLLIDEKIAPARFTELAGLAETIGRKFEARGWWTLRAAFVPTDPSAREALARLREPVSRESPSPGVTLAQALASDEAESVGSAANPARKPATTDIVPPLFRDDAETVGLRFEFDNGRSPKRQIPETTAGGVALLDYDGDGWMDVYVVQGGAFPADPSRPYEGDRLFRNRGDGSFEDATAISGIADMARGFGHGVTVGDIDNDGRPDLFVTRWRSYALYRNRGDGTFADATAELGLDGDRDWPTSAAFADLDNDGDLDLYVCHYLVWDADDPTLCPRVTVAKTSELSDPGQRYNYCTPRPFAALPDRLYRNDGSRFVDVTAEAGIVDVEGRGLGVLAADVDDDGLVDLFVANDTTANYLWRNLGGMKFEEMGLVSGVACNAGGAFQAGMGTACGDIDGDGRLDLFVTNFYGESTTCFRNLGDGAFGDHGGLLGLAGPSRYMLGFGICLLDADNDGRLDVATANGHVNDDRPDYPYQMPTMLLLGGPDGRLVDVTESSGAPWSIPRVSRGLATCDLDNDGRVDLVVLAQKSPLGYFHNLAESGRSLTLELEGTASNRDAVGAVVSVTAGGRRLRRWRSGGGSYQSASDPRLHFGLGASDQVDQVEVRWPSGRVERFAKLEADRGYRLREGDPAPIPLPGPWRRQAAKADSPSIPLERQAAE
ncbi:FG-GAP-like repeat-containing protein [Planctomyces sp. SH-PL62]|uniref:FG-GAP-like repeat-containing protein n=1 Tax=Planctomyces sp. SH-PL62 TaxID=1636152 RepID=UPI00078B5C37|nr:FG-GAP-like repeat-containing protein [Planctomyces sp. SH-PL62]AMV39403.1 ASPIC and UnbV [Planctomyces sp. SH-PL62]